MPNPYLEALRAHPEADARAFQSVLIDALDQQNHTELSLLLERKPNYPKILDFITSSGLSPLTLAAELFDGFSIIQLLSHGASIDLHDEEGFTALRSCSQFLPQGFGANPSGSPHLECIRILVKAGADLTATPSGAEQSLGCLCAHEDELHRQAAIILISEGKRIGGFENSIDQALFTAARRGKILMIELLVAAGACLDAHDKEGLTPFHTAIKFQRPEAASFLESLDIGRYTPHHANAFGTKKTI